VLARYNVSDKTSDFNAPLMQARSLAGPDLLRRAGLAAGVLASPSAA
jgi:branched-chain amino acid transport system substrate-binding protein